MTLQRIDSPALVASPLNSPTGGADACPVPADFLVALESLRFLKHISGFAITELPAGQELAPYVAALEARALGGAGNAISTGRLIILYSEKTQDAWQGNFRLALQAEAEIENEYAYDSLLGEVAWSWLTDSLQTSGAGLHRLTGTITRTINESFGLADSALGTVSLQLRASWTPNTADLSPHARAWLKVLQFFGGLEVDEAPAGDF